MHKTRDLLGHVYMTAFLIYLLVPLLVMGGAAFNDSKLPTIVPWVGFTDRWFIDLWNDTRVWIAFRNTILVALGVVALAVPIGTAGAILINSISGRWRATLYGLMVAPILIPGVVIGISTLLFWNNFNVGAGLHLSVLGQVSYIASFVMLLVLARLQSFDAGLEEAALDLGASHSQVMRRILLPHLYPAIGAGAAIAFFQSIENFNVTLFTRGGQDTLTVYVFSKVRSGITPTINALALLLILFTLGLAIWWELTRRRKARIEAARAAEARRAEEAMA
ncbi:MAG: ABC transporter permease [Tabrizicola sp.]|uniref:ABC transporter permease n=1 Tax=Tabrizicola sp. TaxID=2005166 RepID=UPI002735868C|nr:ABC transporter permease [Tabrizicola sp.]MDP3262849.1 ABC transporter permease [Tabrizicola sp.]MDP3649046.1 ABC transporter permease [Paracoccaceae bacterium]MDZ4065892.1 ABC transporter permease [Tabrizicola sp.]